MIPMIYIQYYDSVNKMIYLMTERCQTNLDKLIKEYQRKPTELPVMSILKQMTRGLIHLHSQGIGKSLLITPVFTKKI